VPAAVEQFEAEAEHVAVATAVRVAVRLAMREDEGRGTRWPSCKHERDIVVGHEANGLPWRSSRWSGERTPPVAGPIQHGRRMPPWLSRYKKTGYQNQPGPTMSGLPLNNRFYRLEVN
jgi:hypothetical protein